MTNIFSLNSKDALDFFMKSDQNQGLELPEYFYITEVINFVRKNVVDRPYEDCIVSNQSDFQGVNFDILLKKTTDMLCGHLCSDPPILTIFSPEEFQAIIIGDCQRSTSKRLKCHTSSGVQSLYSLTKKRSSTDQPQLPHSLIRRHCQRCQNYFKINI